MIFAFAKTLFHDMCNERMTFKAKDIKWKEKLLSAALKMNEEHCQIIRKGKIISPNAYYMHVRKSHVQKSENEKSRN